MKKSQLNIEIYHFIQKLLGKKLTQKLHFSLKKRKLTESGIIFIHVPKAAGTSVAEVLYGQRIGHYTQDEYIEYLGFNQIKNSYIFTVVRDPVERLYSAWKYAVKGGTKDGGVYNADFYKNEVFQDFNTFVQNWLTNQNLNKTDVLFKPQCYFITSKKYKLPKENIFYLNDMEELEKKLSILKNYSVKLPHKNAIISTKNQNTLTTIESKTIEIIKKLYKCDYDQFFNLNDAN